VLKCIFFGTPEFAARTLRDLLDHDIQVLAVVSRPDRPKGRSGKPVPTAVKQLLIDTGHSEIPIYQPEKASDPDFIERMASYDADLFVVVAYGEIRRQALLDVPRLACINVHASLLPAYRGAAPIQRAIIDGQAESGVTIMHMVRKMDAGEMIERRRVRIEEDETFGDLAEKLCQVGCQALRSVIQRFEAGEVESVPQDEDLVTYAPKIELEDCELDWQRPAKELHDLVRGVNPVPTAWAWVYHRGEKKRLKVLRSCVHSDLEGEAGQILKYGKQGFVLGTGEAALELLEVQMQGKRRMNARDLMAGIPQDALDFRQLRA
jgi:methionyl-tRNA formyltransferase